MKKRIFILSVCVALLLMAVALSACSSEKDAMQERIDELEAENAELQSNVTSMRSDLERVQNELLGTFSQLQTTLQALEEARNAAQTSSQDAGGLAITYGGEPNQDMSWPFGYGELKLGLRINLSLIDDETEIIWQSANEDVFIVVQSEDGLTATVTPLDVGSAQLIVTVGEEQTRSWVRIT